MSRYLFPFSGIFYILATLKINIKLIPWRKIMKLWEQKDIMFLSISAKNLIEIQFLGPNLALCLPRKKVSTCTKWEIAYKPYIGGSTCLPMPTLGRARVPWPSPPRSCKHSLACVGVMLSHGKVD